jgi:hypothetical protein
MCIYCSDPHECDRTLHSVLKMEIEQNNSYLNFDQIMLNLNQISSLIPFVLSEVGYTDRMRIFNDGCCVLLCVEAGMIVRIQLNFSRDRAYCLYFYFYSAHRFQINERTSSLLNSNICYRY